LRHKPTDPTLQHPRSSHQPLPYQHHLADAIANAGI